MHKLDEITLLRVLARQQRTQYLTTKKLSELSIPDAILKLVPQNICEKFELFPVQYKKGEKTLIIATSDPQNIEAIDEVRFVSGIASIKALIALSSAIRSAIKKWYKGERNAFDTGLELEVEGGMDMYPGQEKLEIEPSRAEKKPAPEQTESKPEKEEFVDFRSMIIEEDKEPDREEEKEERGDEELFLGAKPTPKKEPTLIIEEISDAEKTPPAKLKLEPLEEPAPAKPKPEELKRAFEQRYRRRMVLVERQEQIRKFITKLFASEGYQVRGFSDLKEAYLELEAGEFDTLVIKERYLDEPGAEFEDHFKKRFPKVELCIIKDYGSAVVGETRTYSRLTSSFLETLDVILGLLEMEGHGPQGHSHNLAKYARLIANKLELGPKEVDAITLAAYVHDLGKKGMKHYSVMSIDATADTAELLEHLEIPLKLLGGAKFPFDIENILKHQYERYDGRGIPDGLKADTIPAGARILALVEAYEVMTNRGISDKPLEPGEALEQLNRQAGKIFDPKMVQIFMTVVRDDIYLKQVEAAQDKILIADTEIDLTTLLELRFIKEGFGVMLARTGAEALQKAKAEKPSLIITEVDLPVKSGQEFVSELIKDEETKHIPFVFLSRRDDPDVVTSALELGAEDYLTKPVKVDVFCAKIKKMLARLKAERKVTPSQPVGVSGSLSEMSLPDIIQILGAGRKTGKIILKNNGQTAEILMEDGRIVNAYIDELKGEDAFYKILWWNGGTFTVDPTVQITERLINMSNDSLMLEGYRRMDEEMAQKGGGGDQDISMDGGDFM
jgi:response regulator RpfG family c-di-GMP phosphodiesterase